MPQIAHWPIDFNFDLEGCPWPWHVCTQNLRFMKYICMPNMKFLPYFFKRNCQIYFDRYIWPLDLEWWPWHLLFTNQHVQLNEKHAYAYYEVCICACSKVMANVKIGNLTYIFDLWSWRMTLTLACLHSKCAASWNTYACQIWRLVTNKSQCALGGILSLTVTSRVFLIADMFVYRGRSSCIDISIEYNGDIT